MRPHEVAASVEPTQWETILAAVREHHPEMWRDLERAACQDQRIPPRLWQRYSQADRRALVRRALGAPASGPLALDVLREYLLHDQRPLVVRFLDLAGVAHEEGVLLEGPVAEPAAATLDTAVDALLAEEPRAMALLYLRALTAQDNVDWPRLEARLAAEAQRQPPDEPPPGRGRAAPAPAVPPASSPPASPPTGTADARQEPPAPATGRASTRQEPPAPAADEGPSARAPAAPSPADTAPPDVTGHAVLAPASPAEPPATALSPASAPTSPGLAPPTAGGTVPGEPWRERTATSPGDDRRDTASDPGDTAPSAGGALRAARGAARGVAAAVAVAPPRAISAAPGPTGVAGTAAADGSEKAAAPTANGASHAAAPGTNGAAPTAHRAATAAAPALGRPRPLPSMATRKSDRAAAPSPAVTTPPGPRETKPARTGTTAVAPRATGPPPPAGISPPAPRAPRPALAPRLPMPPPDPPGLSALDRLLLRTRAASLAEGPGAPDAAEWPALVAEVVGLSVERPRSAYHVGLLAAAGDATAAPPATSAAHAAWFHAGRLAGWAQQTRWAEIARFYADEPGAAGALLRHGEGLDAWAGAWLLAGLLAADVPALAADVLRHCPAVARLAARETLLDAADALLRGDRPAEASVILDVLAALSPLGGMGDGGPGIGDGVPGSPGLDAASSRVAAFANAVAEDAAAPADTLACSHDAAVVVYTARLHRIQAECLQAQGLFGAARARLEAALATAVGPERARLLGALGLVAGEFAQLAELRLPDAEMDPAPWRRRLEAGECCFRAALTPASLGGPEESSSPLTIGEPSSSSEGPSAPHSRTGIGAGGVGPSPIPHTGGATAAASLGLAALEWLSERPAAARPHFEAALAALLADPAAHQRRGVLPQAQFYLGTCLLLDLDAAAHARALDLLQQATAAGFRASAHTWQRLLDLVALDASLADPLFALFSQQAVAAASAGTPFPADLAPAFLMRCAPRSDAARRSLAQECARGHLPADQRWEMLLRLLRAQRQAADPDGARTTLDLLEGLALAPAEDGHARLQRWCDFLADPAHYEPEWSWDDVLWSRVRTFELLGRDDDAFWLLDAPFSRLLAEATPEALAAAEDLLAHARALAVSPEARTALPEMTARLRARQEAARQECALDEDGLAAQLRAGRVLRVLFVGGNETQARHERELRAALEQRDEASGGRVVLEFRTPGFNSNWDKTLEAVRGYRNRVDALVLMPFVRTQLGRALRRLASEFDIPWVPCTGKGYDSMERALRLAILLAASR